MKKEKRITTTNNHLETSLKEQNLSIQLSLDGFSFCIYNPYNNNIETVSEFNLDTDDKYTPQKYLEFVKSIFISEKALHTTFKKVHVTHVNNLVTQVPKPLFKEKYLKNYLEYTIKTFETDYVTFDKISNDIVNVYIPFVNINNFLIDQFGSFEFKHSASIFIDFALANYKNEKAENLCLVNVFSNYFELIIIKNKKFTLYNQFNFTCKEDFIYYILFIAEQLELNSETLKLVFFGAIKKSSELYQITYNYIKNISFYSTKNFPDSLKNNHSPHNYFTLLKSVY